MESLSFYNGFMYVFKRPVGLLNFLWAFLPILGWIALYGYLSKIVTNLIDDKYEEGLPLIDFFKELETGFFLIIKQVPLIIFLMVVNMGVSFLPKVGSILQIIISFFSIYLYLNLYYKKTFESSFEFSIFSKIFENFGDFLITLLKTIGLTLIFLMMSLLIVGIPALIFGYMIFYADFYKRNIKKKLKK